MPFSTSTDKSAGRKLLQQSQRVAERLESIPCCQAQWLRSSSEVTRNWFSTLLSVTWARYLAPHISQAKNVVPASEGYVRIKCVALFITVLGYCEHLRSGGVVMIVRQGPIWALVKDAVSVFVSIREDRPPSAPMAGYRVISQGSFLEGKSMPMAESPLR
jgi:hypothetical protein